MEKDTLIYIVDDEEDIAHLIDVTLKKNNYKTKIFYNGISLLSAIENKIPDIIILDLMLPDISGEQITNKLKSNEKYKYIPIIMVTAKGDEFDKVIGLEIGADDYIAKPFSTRELVARVKAVLRRIEQEHEKLKGDELRAVLNYNDIIKLDINKFAVTVYDEPVNLTHAEFKILEYLIKNRGWVLSRDKILSYLWGNEKYVIDRTIDVHIRHLREKLKNAGKFIKNIRGVGYKIE